MGIPVNSTRNIVFLHKRIEEAFDRQECCLQVQPDGGYKVRLATCVHAHVSPVAQS
jgi:hypothetical protein